MSSTQDDGSRSKRAIYKEAEKIWYRNPKPGSRHSRTSDEDRSTVQQRGVNMNEVRGKHKVHFLALVLSSLKWRSAVKPSFVQTGNEVAVAVRSILSLGVQFRACLLDTNG